jgi:NADPH:quinone reductase-like Zn-dependent oxidoreductase
MADSITASDSDSADRQPGVAWMRAVEYDRYGRPEVLTVRRVARPEPRASQVLVRVAGSSVNPADVKIRAGRMKWLSRQRFPKRTAIDFVGEVAAVGNRVAGMEIGQRVWGFLGDPTGHVGAAAEYVVVEAAACGPAPTSIPMVEAAALPSVGSAALQALRNVLRVRPGQTVLIVGGSGGVGCAAIQLAVAMGATVTAISSTANHGLCRWLGAAHVADYFDLRALTGVFDAVLDSHGSDLPIYQRHLRRGGRMVSVSLDAVGPALKSLLSPGPAIRLMVARPRPADLAALAAYVDSGALRPVIDTIHPLEDIATAHHAVQSGHARGKRIVAVQAFISQ